MNTRSVLLSVIMLGVAANAFAQTSTTETKVVPATQAELTTKVTDEAQLSAARIHLREALVAMRRAMGIYGGHRGVALASAQQSFFAIEKALNVSPTEKPKTEPRSEVKRKAEINSKPEVKSNAELKVQIAVKPAEAVVKTQEEKVAESQANMAKGQAELEAAAKELENAKTWKQTEEGSTVLKQIKAAIEEAKASIKFVDKSK